MRGIVECNEWNEGEVDEEFRNRENDFTLINGQESKKWLALNFS